MFARYFYLVLVGFALCSLAWGHMTNNNAVFAWSLIGLVCCTWAACKAPGPVNVWSMQRELMEVSDQRLPTAPAVTNDSILYTALVLEELAETLTAQLKVMAVNLRGPSTTQEADKMLGMARGLNLYASNMRNIAGAMRQLVAQSGEFCYQATLKQAQEMADGSADLMVTVAGLNETLGLPGEAAYFIVQTSNLSKVNPVTGLIDKHPDGKWIKGTAYQDPSPKLEEMLRHLVTE